MSFATLRAPSANVKFPSATTPNVDRGTGQKPLKPGQIEYLVFEGGGGKGYAYVGALQALEELGGLKKIEGVAGTSAGAITALMISLGMSPKEIEDEINNTDFNAFFDPPCPRLIPQPLEYVQRKPDAVETMSLMGVGTDEDDFRQLLRYILREGQNLGLSQDDAFAALYAGLYLILILNRRVTKFLGSVKSLLASIKPPLSTLIVYLGPYLTYLKRDMGLFSGSAARTYFDKLVSERAAKLEGGNPDHYRNMPFIVHKKIFHKELMVCGANFSTGKTVLFSPRKEHTPYFPVADAVRISMGLPIVYKPYVITQEIPGWPPCGTYVDGGVWNNLPFREIDPDQTSTQESHTLGLRLEIDVPLQMKSIGDILYRMMLGFTGSGESQVLNEFERTMIVLDTRRLSLLEFKPENGVRELVTRRSRRQTYRYFGELPLAKDLATQQDKDDDKKTKELQSANACGHGIDALVSKDRWKCDKKE